MLKILIINLVGLLFLVASTVNSSALIENSNLESLPASNYDEEQASKWLDNMDQIFFKEMRTLSLLYWSNEIDDDKEWKSLEINLAKQFLNQFIEEAESIVQNIMKVRWLMFINMNETNKKAFENITLLSATFSQIKMVELSKFNWRSFKNESLKRGFLRAITLLGDSGITDPNKLFQLKNLKINMNRIYTTAKVEINQTTLSLEPNITNIFTKKRNYDYLKEVWKKWRDASGRKLKKHYPEYINLSNEATREYGFNDYGDYTRSNFELTDLPEQLEAIYERLTPLYKLLHAYVRRKLGEMYPGKINEKLGTLPAHVLGDLWAQQWHNIFEDVKPYKNKPLFDVTDKMLAMNMTIHDLFKTAEHFFESLGLDPMPTEFWNKSVFEKPNDGREINCHASAWDFYNGKDFRIKMCAKVSMNDLFVAHHEMGHIQYYMNYKHQPFHFKEGANPGFHEALGDLMTLSVMTPAHLHKINLIESFIDDEELDVNFLLFSALRNIVFAPFSLTVEKWRWSVYSGKITPANYNLEWWNLRCKYQGLVPPVDRSQEDFDPGSKYHIAASVPYDRYFVSLILTFQFHESLCRASNHTGPLHKCDIYESKEAGKKLRKMMQKGSSIPWSDVLYELTDGRTNKIDPDAILLYFKPLQDWLLKQNLTSVDWQCERFLDRKSSGVKSYETRLNEITNGSNRLAKTNLVAFVFVYVYFSFIRFCFSRI